MNIAGHNLAQRANPYVQSGLVSMYDGIWNQSIGVHDQFATTWRNLAAPDEDLIATTDTNNVIAPLKQVVWNDNGVDGDQGICFWCMDPMSIRSALLGGKISYDVCFTSLEPPYNLGYFSLFGICNNKYDYSNYLLGINWVNATAPFRFHAYNMNAVLTQTNTSLQQNFFSVNIDFGASKSITIFKNGVKATSSTTAISDIRDLNTSGLQVFFTNGGYYDTRSGRCQMNFHALRFYNRLRTEDEIMKNYLIDKERFGH